MNKKPYYGFCKYCFKRNDACICSTEKKLSSAIHMAELFNQYLTIVEKSTKQHSVTSKAVLAYLNEHSDKKEELRLIAKKENEKWAELIAEVKRLYEFY